jgi:hypothetical protein
MAAGILVAALAVTAPASAQPRGDSPDACKRQAVELCARELQKRERGRNVRVDRTIRSDYGRGQVHWSGYMSVQREGPDRSVRVACTVSFDGRNRVTSFEASSGGGRGGGGDAASRACWREAERRGIEVRDVGDTADLGRGTRLVMLRLERRGELLCLYHGSATLYRPL